MTGKLGLGVQIPMSPMRLICSAEHSPNLGRPVSSHLAGVEVKLESKARTLAVGIPRDVVSRAPRKGGHRGKA